MDRFQKKHISLADIDTQRRLLKGAKLNTVCESALCPNVGECFSKGNATFLIMGDLCTRACRFCAVKKGIPLPLDPDEPRRVAEMVTTLGLKYAVITSVTRDDLADGGASHFVSTIRQLRVSSPRTKTEVLVPDFLGNEESVAMVCKSKPNVFSHNIETVPRLYSSERSGADYRRSLRVLSLAKELGTVAKSGLMLGMGEKEDEVLAVMDDLRNIGCDILTLGQYLAPSKTSSPVRKYISDERFAYFEVKALQKGFCHCASGSYVRSSYLAESMIND